MQIAHVGHSTFYTPTHNLALKNVLHVPTSHKNLVFIHRFTRDNHVFVEYHPYVFWLRILTQRRSFCEVNVGVASIPSRPWSSR
jgi:hypothetical protein